MRGDYGGARQALSIMERQRDGPYLPRYLSPAPGLFTAWLEGPRGFPSLLALLPKCVCVCVCVCVCLCV